MKLSNIRNRITLRLMSGEENLPSNPLLNKTDLEIRKSPRINPRTQGLGQEQIVGEKELVEGDADLSSEEESGEDLSIAEMGPKLAEKGKLKGEVSALLVEVEEELVYEEEGGDRSEVDQVLKGLKDLRFNLMSKIGQLAELDDSFEQDTHKEVLKRTNEKVIKLKKQMNELTRAESEARVAKEVQDSVEKEEETKILNERTEILIEIVENSANKLKDEYSKNVKDVSDTEILRRKEEMPKLEVKFKDWTKNIDKLLKETPANYPNRAVISEKVRASLRQVTDLKTSYEDFVKKEIEERDYSVGKKEAASEIVLDKFSGEEAGQDFYTFKSKFEKKYKDVRKSNIPDILKSYLKKEAYESVKELDEADDIWKRLKANFGDPNIMLRRKMTKIYEIANFGSRKSASEVKDALVSLINCLTDVMRLVEEHNIQVKLYGKHEVDDIVGKMPIWFAKAWDLEFLKLESNLSDEKKWGEFKSFLEKQIKLQRLQAERDSASRSQGSKVEEKKVLEVKKSAGGGVHHVQSGGGGDACPLSCGQAHGPHIFECQRFLRVKKPYDRLELLKKTGAYYCYQCLIKLDSSQNQHKCSSKYGCPNSDHQNYPVRLHVVICQRHCRDQVNQDLFETFKKEMLKSSNWASEVKLTFFAGQSIAGAVYNIKPSDVNVGGGPGEIDDEVIDEPMFLLQKVEIDGNVHNLFFDDGCGGSVVSKVAVDMLGDRAVQLCHGPVEIGGVGGCRAEAKFGVYKYRLPLANGKQALFVGPCMETITHEFPVFPLDKLLEEVRLEAKQVKQSETGWPAINPECGGPTNIMIGQKYRRYYPVEVFRLPSGLSVLESKFAGPNGTRGVIGGPSKVVTRLIAQLSAGQDCNLVQFKLQNYFTSQLKLYENGYQMDLDVQKIFFTACAEDTIDDSGDDTAAISSLRDEDDGDQKRALQYEQCHVTKVERKFNEYDEAGCNLDYRCSRCRGCSLCLNADKLNAVSLQEEGEQYLIEESVELDLEAREMRVKLPLLADPKTSLGENKRAAHKIYKQQVEKLNRSPVDKDDVIKSEKKMHKRGHVQYLSELSPEVRKRMDSSGLSHFIPWRSVWNSNSMTTQCRVVFDLSAVTETGLSLNDITPKGINQINNLVVVFTRWRMGLECMHTDITAMYPTLQVEPEYWGLQKYLWSEGLEPGVEPVIKVFMRVIFGGKSSGNLAIGGVRKIAFTEFVKKHFPRAVKVLLEDIYVDDILPEGQATKEDCASLADEIDGALAVGGMSIKGVTFSGSDPEPDLSSDGTSIGIAGMRWHSKIDKLQLDSSDQLNFSKKIRGKKTFRPEDFATPSPLTRRHVAGKVAEVWDLSGLVTPLVARFKLDLHALVERGLDWSDSIPADLVETWHDNFDIMKRIGDFYFSRALVPVDAVSLEVGTIEAGDASKAMMIVGIWTRIARKNGDFSSQLILGKSKLVPKGMTVARAELTAAKMNSHAGHLVHRALGDRHGERIRVTDSEIALHWLNSWDKPLKQFVRGSVIDMI